MKLAVGTKPFPVATHQANASKLQAVRLGRYLVHQVQCELTQGMHLEEKIDTDNVRMMMGSPPAAIQNRDAETLTCVP